MAINYSPETNEAIIVQLLSSEIASTQSCMVAKLLNESGLACLLNGEDVEATQSRFL